MKHADLFFVAIGTGIGMIVGYQMAKADYNRPISHSPFTPDQKRLPQLADQLADQPATRAPGTIPTPGYL